MPARNLETICFVNKNSANFIPIFIQSSLFVDDFNGK